MGGLLSSTVSQPAQSIGNLHNEWSQPVEEFGPNDSGLKYQLKTSSLSNYYVDMNKWEENCRICDQVLKSIVESVSNIVQRSVYEGLSLSPVLLKQGSSRERLKVIKADEFDCIIQFEIEGVRKQWVPVIGNSGNEIPGLLKLRLLKHGPDFPHWITKDKIVDGRGFVNTDKLQKCVFTSILDQALSKINTILEGESTHSSQYMVRRSVKFPNLQLTVFKSTSAMSGHELFSVDFVPGILIESDNVFNPLTKCMMTCERHAVMKWRNKNNPDIPEADYDFIFRNSTSGYEKHVLDVAYHNVNQRYILTAIRLLKTYLKNTSNPNQLPDLINSYHIKNAGMFCILFLTQPNKRNLITGVKQALGYLLFFLQQAIDKKHLPHFFHGNVWVLQMFPDFQLSSSSYNLLETTNSETLTQGRRGFQQALRELKGLYDERTELNDECIESINSLFPQSRMW